MLARAVARHAFSILLLGLLGTGGSVAAGTVTEQIRVLTTSLRGENAETIEAASVNTTVVLQRMYEQRDYTPAWFGNRNEEELFRELNRGIDQGFQPSDFHLPLLYDLQNAARAGDPGAIAAFDVVATDAAIKLLHHLVFGKVNPASLDSAWNFAKPVINQDPAQILNISLDGHGFSTLVARVDIDAPQYNLLVDALDRYRAIVLAGGWPQVPDQTVLKPGMSDPAVAVLRERLSREGVSGEVTRTPEPDMLSTYDDNLFQAVKAFQLRHGLEADGIIGAKTFHSLNKTAQQRVDQLRLSLERGRWLMRDLDDEFVLVNIAAPRTYYFKPGGTVWTARSVTGSAYRQTPIFRDEIQYMEFNPTWTVPASIFLKDKLPRIRKDPGYLARNNYTVVRTSDRTPVNASAVNWAAKNPGVTLVQRPGPDNALGLVKFMFPNKYAVYLHDTNQRELFGQTERNLSSGCVRLEHPFEFANLLMEGDPDWSSQRMQAILDSGQTTRVNLAEPVPVLLTYWTAWVENDEVQFREDPYGRDGAILAALNR